MWVPSQIFQRYRDAWRGSTSTWKVNEGTADIVTLCAAAVSVATAKFGRHIQTCPGTAVYPGTRPCLGDGGPSQKSSSSPETTPRISRPRAITCAAPGTARVPRSWSATTKCALPLGDRMRRRAGNLRPEQRARRAFPVELLHHKHLGRVPAQFYSSIWVTNQLDRVVNRGSLGSAPKWLASFNQIDMILAFLSMATIAPCCVGSTAHIPTLPATNVGCLRLCRYAMRLNGDIGRIAVIRNSFVFGAMTLVNFGPKVAFSPYLKTTRCLSARPRCNPRGVPCAKCLMAPRDCGCAMRRTRSGRIARGVRRNSRPDVRLRRLSLQIA
jgi:hypothetical protein